MRNRLMMLTAALLLASSPGAAQTPLAPQAQPQAPASPFTGVVDVGGLFSTTEGDEARYERYRDTRDGLYSSFRLTRESGAYVFNANASHVGYRDQRYNAAFRNRRIKFAFDWVSLPLNYSYLTLTPFTISGSTLTLTNIEHVVF